ncbi:hypothetical protein PRUPE_3G133200 [Prunus persica]|uniref:Uncharacterized protein n=1 Tax=Prunus persica TaxID=3760 RepID=A0A251PZQ5_PRUPE|nr:hypothetical protein PRUPE_3G133200 [Prunus persica]
MDSTAAATPPYHHHSRSEPPSRTKSASRLAQSGQIPHLSLGLITSSPKRTASPSAHSIRSSDSLPLRELLLLSPSPLRKRSKIRLTDRLEMVDEPAVETAGPRRRCKSRGAQMEEKIKIRYMLLTNCVKLWLAFFISFTIPKLYSCYSIQMNHKVDCLKWWALETWGASSHKKIVAATAFWNLSSVRTRIFTAFISLVILRYCRQHLAVAVAEPEAEGKQG